MRHLEQQKELRVNAQRSKVTKTAKSLIVTIDNSSPAVPPLPVAVCANPEKSSEKVAAANPVVKTKNHIPAKKPGEVKPITAASQQPRPQISLTKSQKAEQFQTKLASLSEAQKLKVLERSEMNFNNQR